MPCPLSFFPHICRTLLYNENTVTVAWWRYILYSYRLVHYWNNSTMKYRETCHQSPAPVWMSPALMVGRRVVCCLGQLLLACWCVLVGGELKATPKLWSLAPPDGPGTYPSSKFPTGHSKIDNFQAFLTFCVPKFGYFSGSIKNNIP